LFNNPKTIFRRSTYRQYEDQKIIRIRAILFAVFLSNRPFPNADQNKRPKQIRHLRDVLKTKGYNVSYLEYANAIHNPEHWRTALAGGIIYLMGKQ
jgi:hypothetical protein